MCVQPMRAASIASSLLTESPATVAKPSRRNAAARAAALRAEGYATVAGLDAAADPQAEARRLACRFFLTVAGPVALAPE